MLERPRTLLKLMTNTTTDIITSLYTQYTTAADTVIMIMVSLAALAMVYGFGKYFSAHTR